MWPYRHRLPTLDESAADAAADLRTVVEGLGVIPAAELVLHLLPHLPAEIRARLDCAWGPDNAARFRVGNFVIRRTVDSDDEESLDA